MYSATYHNIARVIINFSYLHLYLLYNICFAQKSLTLRETIFLNRELPIHYELYVNFKSHKFEHKRTKNLINSYYHVVE